LTANWIAEHSPLPADPPAETAWLLIDLIDVARHHSTMIDAAS
jgi:hypothetical protein